MAQLRAPGGCPWDREQTFDTIKKYLLEETYEVMDSIDAKDWPGVAEELGDLMLQPVFIAQLAAEEGHFKIEDSLDAINEKLVRRHPHIFGDVVAETSDEVLKNWNEIKAGEKKQKPAAMLDPVSRKQPALAEARDISSKAAGVGFDWENPQQVVDKLHEELEELTRAETQAEKEDELGDMLFVLVNLARFYKVDPEQALRKTNAKFRSRFGYVEQRLNETGRPLPGASIQEMEALWQEAKKR